MQGDRGERPGRRPWMDVEVDTDIGSPPYQAWAELLYGFEDAKWWLDLGDLLAGRPGWHVDLNATGGRLTLLWSFGAFGSSLYNVTAVGPGEMPRRGLPCRNSGFVGSEPPEMGGGTHSTSCPAYVESSP